MRACGQVSCSQLPARPPTVAHSALGLVGKPEITPSTALAAVWAVEVFCDDKEAAAGLVRFAFCKRHEVIEEAAARLARLGG